jgi:hypothetical protein
MSGQFHQNRQVHEVRGAVEDGTLMCGGRA